MAASPAVILPSRLRYFAGTESARFGTFESTLLPHGSTETLGLVFTERSLGRHVRRAADDEVAARRGDSHARGELESAKTQAVQQAALPSPTP